MSNRKVEKQLIPVIHFQPSGAKPYTEAERKLRRIHLMLERDPVKISRTPTGYICLALYKETEIVTSNARQRQRDVNYLEEIPRSPVHWAIDLLDEAGPDYDRTMFRTECEDKALDRWGFLTEDVS